MDSLQPALHLHAKTNDPPFRGRWLILAALALFAVVVIDTAWVCDDAYITFRTVDNFIRGYGLRWNTDERVQAYTHPLWMFLLSGLYRITLEIYYTSIFASIFISVAAVAVLAFGICPNAWTALSGLTILIFSRAFMDFSTSGLESPLTHLLLALFYFVYFWRPLSLRNLAIMSLLASLGGLNRLDCLLLYLPGLAWATWKLRRPKAWIIVCLGFLPLALWEMFSLFYYGFPLPNTAYAKLHPSIGKTDLIRQGFFYLLNSIKTDPLTLTAIAVGLVMSAVSKEGKKIVVGSGILLSLLYVIRVGGDFMSGRFLTPQLFCAVLLLAHTGLSATFRRAATVLGIAAAFGFLSGHAPILSGANYAAADRDFIDGHGVGDERYFYYGATGLLRARRNGGRPNHPWVHLGVAAHNGTDRVIVEPATGMGFYGFYAGPNIHIVDGFALTDPFLSKIPIRPVDPLLFLTSPKLQGQKWRIGHFDRPLPNGYADTLRGEKNVLQDKNLAEFYDKIAFITRGDLFDRGRLHEIWNVNLGKYNYLLKNAVQEP